MAVLDFEEFPSDEEQRLALVRFRLRKSVPFPIDEAQVSCSVQVQDSAQKRIEVLAVAVARPVLSEYEDLLHSAGFQVGWSSIEPGGARAVRQAGGRTDARGEIVWRRNIGGSAGGEQNTAGSMP